MSAADSRCDNPSTDYLDPEGAGPDALTLLLVLLTSAAADQEKQQQEDEEPSSEPVQAPSFPPQLTAQQRSNFAWRMLTVMNDPLTRLETARATGCGVRIISVMRRVKAAMEAEGLWPPTFDTWRDAKAWDKARRGG